MGRRQFTPHRIGGRVLAALLGLSGLCGQASAADCPQPLEEETIQRLDLEVSSSLQPGQGAHFILGVWECCVFIVPVPACVEWSVDPPGAAEITLNEPDRVEGTITASPTLENGAVITLRADVEAGRRKLGAQVHVYTPQANPLVGYWREVAQRLCPEEAFVRGDVDSSGEMDITDGIHVLSYLFLDAPAPACLESADSNGDHAIDISDGTTILGYLFLDGAAPPAPFPACGAPVDPPTLGCNAAPACQGAETAPAQNIEELVFEADGTFSVTWTPFEVYRDYWGIYAFDLASGAINFTIDGGNFVPTDFRSQGSRFALSGGDLILEDLWFGTRNDFPPSRPHCGHRFSPR